MKRIAIIIALIAPTAHAASIPQHPLDPASVKKIKSMDTPKQCVFFGKLIRGQIKDKDHKLRDAIDAELKSNGKISLIRDIDYDAIKNKEPEIGMSVCALVAAVGRPERTNTSHTARGASIQAVYPNGMYVYLDDGIVTGWQE
jgi:hypothetical protein